MEPTEILVTESRGVARESYIVEQGIPVQPMSREDAAKLRIFDDNGNLAPANIQAESVDYKGDVRWLLVSLAVDSPKGGERRYVLKESDQPTGGEKLQVSIGSEVWKTIKTKYYTAEFNDPGTIRITTADGTVLDGPIDFDIRSDARSTVGGQRPVYYEPHGFKVLERTDKRVKILLKGRYRAYAPKQFYYDEVQRYDADVEFTLYADSPTIRLKWIITDYMRFNCPYMWLDRYVLSFPLAQPGTVTGGDEVEGEDKFGRWATAATPGGTLGVAFWFYDWLGKGAGIEVKDGRIGIGGINPPPDGGFGGKYPDIWRKFYYGMSRSFEASIIINPSHNQIMSEINHIPLILDAEYYSKTGALPESGSKITFGPWKDVVDRAAAHLLDTQWKGTLWFGEWWREWDVDHNLGIEETNSGNSALGPLYHFYRTGDWRFWESAKMSYYYTYDIQFCKREDGWGPYMHTRRFLLDHQEWFHPRYQRVGGMMKLSHFFGDAVYRDKVIWYLRFWGDNYVAEDGSPMTPHGDGREKPTADQKSKCTESAMSNFADSLMYAYMETGDEWFLEKAKLIGDWVVRGAEADLDEFCGNSNSTRYILRGLLSLCQVTGDQRYIDTFVKISKWTVDAPTFEYGTHYVAFHFYYASQAYKWSGRKDILEGILKLAKWVLSNESKDWPGTYPFPQKSQYPPSRWWCIYDNKAIVSYLPVLASALEEAGISAE